ncbi:predicted protein [Phaeodactylum tricornutum CCAP 1055/1]|uniref:Cell division control protein 73 C-terminal domain-containing protein n=1 Tax=Phaeodactylum tricornutum (strain CCAP 1055/1) TaxID=556484 RepID=B7G1T7_PHATC|nr:predicted protein [Phaeodactylum tricornutum CCAP 1055/1]EEC47743.1 predicted protein [Phaeodactylum tricornutum CCAP 1055/1]|eukprot:XP_002181091.1 predicted protein [Phaeodactylum tricornutum CCAP 1055/1]
MSDPDRVRDALSQWVAQSKLKDARVSEDGQSVSLDGTTLPNEKLTITFGEKSCSYSLVSIYLQILDPDQGVLAYRNACKKYNVTDPVKTLDKGTILGYFASSLEQPEVSSAKAAEIAVPTVPVEEKPSDKLTEKSRKHQEHRSSKDKHGKRKHRSQDPKVKKEKKRPKLVTNEQLISNLSEVVDKRHLDHNLEKEEITKALSTEGFEVTPELLEENKEATQTITANEIPVGNSASILRAANPRKDLSRVLELYNDTVNPPSSKSKNSSSTPFSSGKPKNDRSYLVGKKPVIVVPKGMTAPITIINAHEFLANARFVPRDVMVKQGRQRTPATSFTRNVPMVGANGTAPLEYEIVDTPKKLGPDPREWERIVAVFVLGQSWQFKDWGEKYNDPVHLFARTYGFFVSMEGAKLPAELAGWSVRKSQLNRDKRGLDSVSFASFWNGLDEWMTVHKRELLPHA